MIIKLGLKLWKHRKLNICIIPVCLRVEFGIHYMHMMDVIFMRRANQSRFIKDEKSFIIIVHKGKSNISLVSAN